MITASPRLGALLAGGAALVAFGITAPSMADSGGRGSRPTAASARPTTRRPVDRLPTAATQQRLRVRWQPRSRPGEPGAHRLRRLPGPGAQLSPDAEARSPVLGWRAVALSCGGILASCSPCTTPSAARRRSSGSLMPGTHACWPTRWSATPSATGSIRSTRSALRPTGPRRSGDPLPSRHLRGRDLGGAHAQRQRAARGDGPPGHRLFRRGAGRHRARRRPAESVLHDYFAWSTEQMSRYHRSADDVPDGLRVPRWSWDGLQPAS